MKKKNGGDSISPKRISPEKSDRGDNAMKKILN